MLEKRGCSLRRLAVDTPSPAALRRGWVAHGPWGHEAVTENSRGNEAGRAKG